MGGAGQEEVGRRGGTLLEIKRGMEEEGHQEGEGWSWKKGGQGREGDGQGIICVYLCYTHLSVGLLLFP